MTRRLLARPLAKPLGFACKLALVASVVAACAAKIDTPLPQRGCEVFDHPVAYANCRLVLQPRP